jgi:3-hydroxyacyl-CoA dehydrogenase/enoyl-CoA hydratase/3-hydroxybutyryl-CoA epimerase/3-hydroxyacyl-CoA dehydrogenase/enoyl-CoA hydratase/3-hydroxybutyryl-CoA epimerase/enoyl-CoA isomerase
MPQDSAFRLTFPAADIAVLTFDRPDMGANVLSQHVLSEFSGHLDALEARKELAGLIIGSGKPGIFIAGADLREFAATMGAPASEIVKVARQGQELFARLSRSAFITVAAIDGICVGGGAELAAWCDRRIMTSEPKTEFGFPEVKLGLFPGWGGTVRLPRIIGIGNAVEMITGGESISPGEARKLGLVSDVVSAEKLLEAAIELVRLEQRTGEYLHDRQRWQGPLPISEGELGFLGATASAYIRGQTKGNYPAPEAALEVMLGAATADAAAACQMEAEGFAPLFGSPVNRALLNVFFLTDRNKKDKGVDADKVESRKVRRAGVIGAGIMGAGIAAASVKREVPVTMIDANEQALARGVKNVIQEVAYNRSTKKPDAERAIRFAPLLQDGEALSDLSHCDLVIEAVVENLEAKRKVFAELEPQLPEHAILASNTSTIPITKLAQDLARPEQFVGIHFFNPVRQMKLVEVIRGAKTSDETVASAVAYAKRLGKMPIVVGDGPGFLVNRLLFPYMNEALALLGEGVPVKQVEKAAVKFGMPMGPIELYDMVGIDTALYCGATVYEAYPSRVVLSPILPALKKLGRLGQKTGKGFYSYENKRGKAEPDPEFAPILETYVRGNKSYSPEELQQRLFLPMLLEATRVLEEHKVRDVRDIDLGLIFGLGFPPFKGGLLFWADTLGAQKIIEMLKPWEHLGERFSPTPLLRRMAEEGTTFYENDKAQNAK